MANEPMSREEALELTAEYWDKHVGHVGHEADREEMADLLQRRDRLARVEALEEAAKHFPIDVPVDGGTWLGCVCGWIPEEFVANDETGSETWQAHICALGRTLQSAHKPTQKSAQDEPPERNPFTPRRPLIPGQR